MESARRTFSLLCCLGRGGFGEVYLAEMSAGTGVPVRVAAKVLRAEVAEGGQAVRRLQDEARALSRLTHPSILKVHDLVVLELPEGGRVALISEYIEGEDLATCLPGMGLRTLLEALARVAWALDAAWHSPLKLVHRDVKPANIRIGRHGEVKLLDFGIAKAQQMTRDAQTRADMMVGSLPYVAPERFLDKEPHPASDVFSLGCVLHEALTGQRGFDLPMTLMAGMALDPTRHRVHLESQLSLIPANCPQSVRELIAELLQSDPSRRPQARALAERMERLAEQLEGPTLARFCREHLWADPIHQSGELSGKVLTEGTFELPMRSGSRDKPVPARPRSRWWPAALLGLGLSSAGLLAGGVSLLIVLAGLGLWLATATPPARALPARVVAASAPTPGGNQEACLAYIETLNALPCYESKLDPSTCEQLDMTDCDMAPHFRCRAEQSWCEGSIARNNYDICPDSCATQRVSSEGPTERACRDYWETFNALECTSDVPIDKMCHPSLETQDCGFREYYECAREAVTCNELGPTFLEMCPMPVCP
jgi:serine/threonine protein kinase